MTVYRVKHKATGKFWRGGKFVTVLRYNHTYSARTRKIEPTPMNCWLLNTFTKHGKIWLQDNHLKSALKQLPKEVLDELEVIAYHLTDEVHNTFPPADILATKALAK